MEDLKMLSKYLDFIDFLCTFKRIKNNSMKFNTCLMVLLMLPCMLQSPANQSLAQANKALLQVVILDRETQEQTPVRVHLTMGNGTTAGLPPEAISVMYGRNDHPEGYGSLPDSSFYVDGEYGWRQGLSTHAGSSKN